jgi:hypothetical protein
MYIRKVDVPKLAAKYGSWEFRTKHELGVAVLTRFMQAIRELRPSNNLKTARVC